MGIAKAGMVIETQYSIAIDGEDVQGITNDNRIVWGTTVDTTWSGTGIPGATGTVTPWQNNIWLSNSVVIYPTGPQEAVNTTWTFNGMDGTVVIYLLLAFGNWVFVDNQSGLEFAMTVQAASNGMFLYNSEQVVGNWTIRIANENT